jgi:small subunit ribosomal protein S4
LQLREKQKARNTYGLLERQFRNLFVKAGKTKGVTGDIFVQLLESRLDNVVYRLGFAKSRAQARQIVRHGLIMLNGRKTDIPSCLLKSGDVVAWTDKGIKTELYRGAAESVADVSVPSWMSVDKEKLVGRFIALPVVGEVAVNFDANVIVEYYSR